MTEDKPSLDRRKLLKLGASSVAASLLTIGCAPLALRCRKTMTSQFRPLSTYKDLPAPTLAGLDAFDPTVAPAGRWPLVDGTAARNGRGAEPLLQERWSPEWRVALEEAGDPNSILIGGGYVVAQSKTVRTAFNPQGVRRGTIPFGGRAVWVDSRGPRLLADGAEGGLYSYRLPKGDIECSIALSLPSDHRTGMILPGPDNLLLVLTRMRSPSGRSDAVVEVVRVTDWTNIRNGTLYGLDPVAGIIREADSFADAALASSGPVLATREGIVWCNWQLCTLAEHRHDLKPLVMSVDASGRAFFIGQDERFVPHFVLVPPKGPPLVDLPLPKAEGFELQPPVIAANGACYLLQPGEILALDPSGKLAWRLPCAGTPRATLTSNGLLLLSDGDLFAVDPTGQATRLWQAPSPLTTPPILALDHIFVASADELFLLRAG